MIYFNQTAKFRKDSGVDISPHTPLQKLQVIYSCHQSRTSIVSRRGSRWQR